MRALSEDIFKASGFNMAMTTRTWLFLLGAALLLVGGQVVWFFVVGNWVMGGWAKKYQQTNATWRIKGVCTDAETGAPIEGAEITAYFFEPVGFKHHWRNKPPLVRTDVVTKTGLDGRFEVLGQGGSVVIKVRAEGYRDQEPWEYWSHRATNGISRVDTNVALSLQPASKPTREVNSREK